MKKWIFLSLIPVVAGCIYFFMPARVPVSKVVGSKCSLAGANRFFTDTSKWVRWWPRKGGNVVRRGRAYIYDGYVYTVTGLYYNRVELAIGHDGDSVYGGYMQLLQVSADSLMAGAGGVIYAGKDPVKRVLAYRQGSRLLENMKAVLDAFKAFTEAPKNIYGINIVHTMSTDSILMTLSGFSAAYPTTEYVYWLIDSVRRYVDREGARVHNPPHLNVAVMANGQYRTMVALSVNKPLAGSGGIVTKRFVPWKMIEGNAHGGAHTADHAIEQLYKFRDDYHLDIMSIPFELLITDRRLEPDTSKWVTRVSAPIS